MASVLVKLMLVSCAKLCISYFYRKENSSYLLNLSVVSIFELFAGNIKYKHSDTHDYSDASFTNDNKLALPKAQRPMPAMLL